MITSDLKNIVLKMFGDREFYGYQVHKMLVTEGVKVDISRLYRVLNEMLKEELLESRWEKSRIGPRKKIYQLGKRGREELKSILLDAIKTVHGFYGSYLMKLLPKVNIVDDIVSLFMDGLEGEDNVAYVISKYSRMNEVLISTLQIKVPQIKIFLVKPGSVEVDLNLDNVSIMDGTYRHIPLKYEHVNRLLVIDLPKTDHLEAALKEWQRVLKRDGMVVICTPTILVSKYEDPLKIGEFIEKYEHEDIERGEPIDKDFLQALLKKFFNKIEEREIVHMTFFRMSNL